MPIYEYECTDCARQFDVMQKISEPALRDCPHCKSPSVRRLLSASGFQLKGSGWYVSDYKPKTASEKSTSTVGDKPAASE